ncbi:MULTISPECIES: hypothetical protein [Nitratidesulfovibrio]|uniref:hypothetical protein n=1 Tax=Nitratidesulfovibrio TaxID=2802295 RepID=UPI00142260A0|nr:hypothetical protein [Nitratidesulfovibrio liaohensis]NHZ48385.1 hypothetical protein [Nitratidesulfovibrio liaohensis]
MVVYPIRVHVKGYSGSNQRKREKLHNDIAVARKLEEYTNTEFKRRMELGVDSCVFLYANIARATGVDVETVSRLMFSVDCGSNGFTICAPGHDPLAR